MALARYSDLILSLGLACASITGATVRAASWPPPSPPVIESPELRAAEERARSCFEHPDRGGFATRLDADRATRHLGPQAGDEKWKQARKIVLSYAKGQQAAARCIANLQMLAREGSGPPKDLLTLRKRAEALHEAWLTENQFELQITLRLLDRDVATAQGYMPHS